MILIIWLRKTVLGPFVHSVVWGRWVQIGRCCYSDNGHSGGKEHGPTRTLTHLTFRIPCKHYDHRVTEPHGRPVTVSPYLIRFVPESAQNLVRQVSPQNRFVSDWLVSLLRSMPKLTRQSLNLLLAARAWTHAEPSNATDRGEEKAHRSTETLTKDLSHTVRAHWPPSYWATLSTCWTWKC